jgi:hypothetical protein
MPIPITSVMAGVPLLIVARNFGTRWYSDG